MATQLAKAYVQIVPTATGIKGKLESILSPEVSSVGKEAGESLGSKLASTAAKVIGGVGIGKALASSLTEGANLEQSLGGVETLFKKNADAVIKYADQAYKTAGLSSNDYMEQVTSFSAALLQSLGGDTAKAAEVADMALVDMSDNANKFGSDAESIQNAYQGFAKQNYTMLDNLKLGYGGTKSEMERLLSDAEKISGQEYDISNLNDVYQAIHVIQENLDITGTTSKEAATTFSGSFTSMKAAASNLLGNIALGRDIQGPLNALAETTSTFLFGNFVPMLGRIVTALPEALGTAGPLIAQMGQQGLQGAMSLITGLSSGLAENIPVFLENALPMILNFTESLRSNAGQLVDAGLNMIMQLAQGIANSMPALITYIPQIVTNIAGIINDNAPKILTTGVQIIVTLAKGLIQAIPTLIANIPNIITAIVAVISAFNWLQLGGQIVTGIKNGIIALKGQAGTAMGTVKTAVINAIKNLPKNLLNLGKNGISGLKAALSSGTGVLGTVGRKILTSTVNALKSMPSKLLSIAAKAISSMKNSFTKVKWSEVGTNIIKGIARGVTGGVSYLLSAARKAASDALSAIKKKLGIKSPSTVFRDEVGRYIALGMAAGIDENSKAVTDSVNRLGSVSTQSIASGFRMSADVGGNNNDQLISKIVYLLEKIANGDGNQEIVIKLNNRETARALKDMGVVFA
jgi:phage-related protein